MAAPNPDRPPNSRIFVGNLASEKTTKKELLEVFGKYGNIIEEPVIRRSFGFIQFDNPDSARRAIEGEQGQLIGGMKLDLSIADNREPRSKAERRERRPPPLPLPERRAERRAERAPYPPPERRPSPPGARRRSRSPPPPPVPPTSARRSHALVQVFFVSQSAKDFARSVDRLIGERGLRCECLFLDRMSEREAVDRAARDGVHFVLFIDRPQQQNNSALLTVIHSNGRIQDMPEMNVHDAVDLIVRHERSPQPPPPRAGASGSGGSVLGDWQPPHAPFAPAAVGAHGEVAGGLYAAPMAAPQPNFDLLAGLLSVLQAQAQVPQPQPPMAMAYAPSAAPPPLQPPQSLVDAQSMAALQSLLASVQPQPQPQPLQQQPPPLQSLQPQQPAPLVDAQSMAALQSLLASVQSQSQPQPQPQLQPQTAVGHYPLQSARPQLPTQSQAPVGHYPPQSAPAAMAPGSGALPRAAHGFGSGAAAPGGTAGASASSLSTQDLVAQQLSLQKNVMDLLQNKSSAPR